MKLTIEPKTAAELITWAARALPNRPVVPVLSGLLLDAHPGADGDTLTVSAFDYDVSVQGTAPCDIAEPGRIILPGRLLAEIVKALPTKSMIELTADEREATITCGSAYYTLLLLPANDYPTLPQPPEPVGTVDGEAFAAAVAQIHLACSRDDTLPMLFGIRIDADGNQLTLAATDRYRIAVHDLTWQPNGPQTLGQLIPGRTLNDAARHLHGPVTIGLNESGLAALSTPDRVTTMRLLDEQFIDYRARVTAPTTITARVDAAALTEAAKRVGLVAERTTAIHLAFTNDQVRVTAGGPDTGRGGDTVPCELDGDPIDIVFQSTFLLEALTGVAGKVHIGMTGPVEPAVFASEDRSYQNLVMSLRVTS
jgi:DNA polymerase-3 subunit beta